jgi:DNA-binding phage protein
VFNLRAAAGNATYFEKNQDRILYLGAEFIAAQAGLRRRTLTVIKKTFASNASVRLQTYLRDLTGQAYRVIVNPPVEELSDPLVVPMLTYGINGVNIYQDFDCALALSAYHARNDVLTQRMNDGRRPEHHVKLSIASIDGRRQGVAVGYEDRALGFDSLADAFLHQLETAVAEQCLARVRFTVRPRIVVFFGDRPPRFPLTREFCSLEAFRGYFGLKDKRTRSIDKHHRAIHTAYAAGATAEEIMRRTGMSRATVYRRLRELRQSHEPY